MLFRTVPALQTVEKLHKKTWKAPLQNRIFIVQLRDTKILQTKFVKDGFR